MNTKHSITWYYNNKEYHTRKELQKDNNIGTTRFRKLCTQGIIYYKQTNLDNNNINVLLPYERKEITI